MDKIVDGVRIPMTPAEEAEVARIAALPRRRTKGTVRRQLSKLDKKASEMIALTLANPGPAPKAATDWAAERAALKAELDSL